MPKHKLPSILLGTLEIPCLIAGSNAISGFSHSGSERTKQMLEYFTVERIKQHLFTCEVHGIEALVARTDPFIIRVLAEYWREGGGIRWIAQTAPEYRDPFRNIRQAQQAGASAIYIHGSEVDRLLAKGQIEELRARVEAIRAFGLPAGVAAHNPKNLLKVQKLGIAVDFYLVCLYNLSGYSGRRNVEPTESFNFSERALALETLVKLDRPCIVYKVLGAGRLSLAQGLADVSCVLRPSDGILIGMFPPDYPNMVEENVRYIANLSRAQ